MKKKAFRTVFLDTLPVMTGYLFLGAGFGILLNQNGFGMGWSFFMSLFIYAGSAQYMAVSLLTGHASLLSAGLATLLLNARHLFYGISLVDTYKDSGGKKPYLIFGLTDETYSLVTQNEPPKGMTRHQYCFWVTLFDHSYWVLGSILGSIAGAALPISFEGVDFVLTALFVTLFVEQWLENKNHLPALIGVMSTALCLILIGKDFFLVPSMVIIALLLAVTKKTAGRTNHV